MTHDGTTQELVTGTWVLKARAQLHSEQSTHKSRKTNREMFVSYEVVYVGTKARDFGGYEWYLLDNKHTIYQQE